MVVYKITNNVNGKCYIGQTVQPIQQRWARHCWEVTAQTSNMPISKAIKKYGKSNFSIIILENAETQYELDSLEIYYCKLHNTMSPNGYNLKAGKGRGACSDALKKKISLANMGKTRSDAQKKRLSEAHLGIAMSESTKEKLRSLYKGRSVSTLGPIAMANRTSVRYDLISPDGILVSTHNMKQFCIGNGLSPSKMCEVIRGKRSHHKGWKRNAISFIKTQLTSDL